MELSRYADAEPLLMESYEKLRGNTAARPIHAEITRRYLVELYTILDRPKDAARYSSGPESSL